MTRYSLLYCRSEMLSHDDKKMRVRLGALFDRMSSDHLDEEFSEFILQEMGVSIITLGFNGFHIEWTEFIGKLDLEDLFDLVSLYSEFFIIKTGRLPDYVKSVERIFRERNVSYRIDKDAVIHPYIDMTFFALQENTIRGLRVQQLGAAIEHLNAADRAMLGENPDWREALRRIFDAAENVFKQMFDGETQLGTKAADNRLKVEIEQIYASDQTALRFANKQYAAFKSWIEAAHFYRHEPGKAEPTMPPADLAINFISQGLGHIRWLSDLTPQLKSKQK